MRGGTPLRLRRFARAHGRCIYEVGEPIVPAEVSVIAECAFGKLAFGTGAALS